MVFFNFFFNFFATFFEFSITGWVGTHWNDFFCFFFLSFSAFPNLLWLGKMQQRCFLIFLNFLLFFFEFSITGRVGTHWNDFFFLSYSAFPNLFSLFLDLPQHILPRKEAIIVFSIFWEFSMTGRVGTHWNDFFFLSYSTFPNLFSLFLDLPQHILPRKEAIIVFSIFWEFSITGQVGTPRNDFFFYFFILSLSWPFPTYFGLKSCQNVGF